MKPKARSQEQTELKRKKFGNKLQRDLEYCFPREFSVLGEWGSFQFFCSPH